MSIKYLAANNCEGVIRVLKMEEIFPHVEVYSDDFYSKLKEDIDSNGMNYPLVVTRMSPEVWKCLSDVNPDMLPPPVEDREIYQVRCGNNRYRIAKEKGYTMIDCYVVDLKEANRLCYEQRSTSTY